MSHRRRSSRGRSRSGRGASERGPVRNVVHEVGTSSEGRTLELDCGHTVTVRTTSPKRARCYLCLGTPEVP